MLVGKIARGVRRVLQRIVIFRQAAGFDVADFRSDRNHSVAKAVKLRLRFRFRRFDHQRTRDGEAHGRCMETIVDQPFGNIVDRDAAPGLERPRVNDAFVGDATLRPRRQPDSKYPVGGRYNWH